MCLFVTSKIAKKPELFWAVFTGEISDCVTKEMLLVVALVAKDLIACLADKLDLRLLLLDFQSRSTNISSDFTTFTANVLLHMFAQVNISAEDTTTLGAGILLATLAPVFDLVIVQQHLRSKEHAAEFAMVGQWQIVIIQLVLVNFFLDLVAFFVRF